MRMLKLNKQNIYWCKKYVDNNMALFEEPILIKANPVTLSSAWGAELIGLVETGKLVFALDRYRYDGFFTVGDKFYVYTTYTDFDGSAQDADYVLNGISLTPNVVGIVLNRLAI